MKRQGKVGFTWDSKAEEWLDWCMSVWEHDEPRSSKGQRELQLMMNDYSREYHREARHSPAQRDLTPQPYSYPTHGPERVLWALFWAAMGGIVFAAVAILFI